MSGKNQEDEQKRITEDMLSHINEVKTEMKQVQTRINQ